MASESTIPQDIFENIVNHLHDDPNALKECATVSRLSLHPSRKHLFSTIHLEGPDLPRKLYSLVLAPKPELALYIRKLYIKNSYTVERPYHTGMFTEDQYLPSILILLDRLQLLSLSQDYVVRTYWDGFLPELRSALVERFQSPSLTILEIMGFPGLPVSLITNLNSLKQLSLDLYDLHDYGGQHESSSPSKPTGLSQLEVLDLRNYANQPGAVRRPTIFPPMGKLRLLSLTACNGDMLPVAHEVIRCCAGSIKSIFWDWFSGSLEPSVSFIPLGIMENLQFISFSVTMARTLEETFSSELSSTVQFFADHSIGKDVKRLTIAVELWEYSGWDDLVNKFCCCRAWGDVDHILSKVSETSPLEEVSIILNPYHSDMPDGHYLIQIQAWLPLLRARGLLSLHLATKEEVREAAWASANVLYHAPY